MTDFRFDVLPDFSACSSADETVARMESSRLPALPAVEDVPLDELEPAAVAVD